MDFSGGNVVQVITGSGPESWSGGDHAMWATEDDYRAWSNNSNGDDTPSTNSNYDQRQSQSRSGSEPPSKKSRNSQDVTSSNRSKAIGKMFFKTKLCCKFRAGTCPYITNCNFAHSIEELRRPPPNWQEIVAAHEEERTVLEPREEYQIPSLGSSGYVGETQRSYKGRHCKKFYTEEGCPYGDNCTFLHDEQSKNRESVAISLVESQRISALKPLLKEFENGHLPFLCLQYKDSEGVQHSLPAVYLGKVDSLSGSKLENMISADDAFALNVIGTESSVNDPEMSPDFESSYYVALGSDNMWYLFTEKWVKTIYRTGFPNVALAQGDALPREIMRMLLDKEEMKWEKLVYSELGCLWRMEGSLETWSWSLNVPVLNSLSERDELLQMSEPYHEAVERYKEQRNKVARLKKKIARTEGFKEYKKIVDMAKFTEEKIKRLKVRSKRLSNRVEQIEPSGWKEFLKISKVIHELRALDINTHVIFPLGETASAIRGENELWLAMVLRNKILLDLKPAQLAAACGSLVSEGIKVRPWKNNSYIYEPSTTVLNVIKFLDEQRSSLLQLQEKHGVNIPCCLDSQFSGMVEAWASGLTWREMMMDCAMDEGDLARLLRRTIDLLAQIPKLPDIDPLLQSNAKTASSIMDRPPISELAG